MITPDENESIAALVAAVEAALRVWDIDAARDVADRAVAAATSPRQRVEALYWRARCDYLAGHLEAALVCAATAAREATAMASAAWVARVRALESRCLASAGDTQAALERALAAVACLQTGEGAGDDERSLQVAEQAAAISLGNVYQNLNEQALALQWCRRACDLAEQVGDTTALGAAIDTVACVLGTMATQARQAGDAAQAEAHDREAIACSSEAVRIARANGHLEYEASALFNLAEALSLVGEHRQALALLEDWSARHPSAPLRHRAHYLDTLATIHIGQGAPDRAIPLLEEGLRLVYSTVHRATVMLNLATALEQCERWQEALARFKEYHSLQARVSDEQAQRSARIAAVRLDTERERARASALADSNRQLRRRADDLQRMSLEDPLTGLANRRQVDTLLAGDVGHLWLAVVDADHFKRINDNHSHALGDAVLRQLATIMRECCRPEDTPARLGGEEFVVLYKGGPDAAVGVAAERLRTAIAAYPWDSLAAGLQVTVSIGLAHGSEVASGAALLGIGRRAHVRRQARRA